MLDERIERINELARKAKTQGLTPEEQAEQAKLRREYIEAFKRSLTDTLEHTYIVDEEGNKTKLTRKDED